MHAGRSCQIGTDFAPEERNENSTPPPAEAIGGIPAYAQRGPCDWNPAVLHNAFLASRFASIGFDSTLLSLPVKVAPMFRASTVLPKLEL